MLNWSNALSAVGGATAALGLEGVRASLDQQKVELASRLAEQRQVAAEQRAPGVAAATTTATADATAAATVRNAPGLLNVEVKRTEAVNAANLKAELEKFEKLAPLQRQEAIDTAVEKVKALSTPEMLANTRKIAEAGHIVDPSYSLVPNADGTVTTFDSRSGKSGGTLKDSDGKPIVRKDPEEMKAAVAVINLANTNLRIAEAAYKVDAASLEPGVKEKAGVAWEAAQREARQLTAPAYAVLYDKAKIPGVKDATPAGKTGWDDKTGEVWKNGEKVGKAKSAREASAMIHDPAAAVAPKEEPTTMIPPGGVDPNVAVNEQRRAAIRAREEAELEEARKRRLAGRAADEGLINKFNSALSR